MAAIKDDAMMVEITRITKRAELVDEHVQISYYCGDFKVAHELHDSKGNVVQASGSIPDGTVKEYYDDGILKEAALFQDGKANGRSILYYPDGKIFEMKNYTNGLLHGWFRTYRRNGTLWMQSSFFEGKLHGRFTSYHNNGIAEIKAEYWNGRLNGHSLIYDRAGNLRKEGVFIMGKRNGEHLSYCASGELARCETYRSGWLLSCEEYTEDGMSIATWDNGHDRRPRHCNGEDSYNSA